jgi:beta-lactamase superfamily II metal-dependent hydrolase
MPEQKSPLSVMIIAVIVVLLAGGLFVAAAPADDPGPDDPGPDHPDVDLVESGELSIHFLELGNKYTGDCVYIKYGDIDIIIDAGSETNSAKTIIEYINGFTEDGIIEYVIATHAHKDHIAGFYAAADNKNIGVLDAFEIKTIIDYPLANGNTVSKRSYEAARDKLVAEKGTAHYTALECYNESKDGAQRRYQLDPEDPGIYLEILYNYYYDHTYSSNENNYSVCLMIVNGDDKYLFTGDLESGGENRLAGYYGSDLGHCVLWKGGHHGSQTSGSASLMSVITPDYIIICTCVGSSEYGALPQNEFPAQSFIDRIAPYTVAVYATTLMNDYKTGDHEPLNGTIVFSVIDGNVTLTFSNNGTLLKDTDWFKANRITPEKWKTAGAG